MSSGHGHGSPLPFYDRLAAWVEATRDKSGTVLDPMTLAIAGVVVLFACLVFVPGLVGQALSLALFLTPLWLPWLLASAAFRQWLILRRSIFIAEQETILLELIPPRSIEKTPLAMETIIAGLHLAPGEGNWYAINFQGKVRPWWSLEIVSTEGKVHFYIQTRASFRRLIESQVYSQYPGAQVIEVPDYTRQISADHHEYEIWGCDYVKGREDPYPIKTYVDYGLDKVAKEPEQVDPLSNLVEFLGSMGKGEHLWLQFIIRVTKSDKYGARLNKAGKPYTWKDEALEIVQKIREETRSKFVDQNGVEQPGFPNPTKGQSETMAAIERNVSKLGFDVGVRMVYVAKPESFSGTTIPVMSGIFKQFNSEGYNLLKWTHWMLQFQDYPWEIGVERRKAHVRHGLVDAYRRRSFFHVPYESHYSIMSTEELATVFHIPSASVPSPALPRIQSSTSEAPPGLPT